MAIKCIQETLPKLYCYSTPGVTYHDGWIKIGYTEQQVDKRIQQQTNTAGIKFHKEWEDVAVYRDGSGLTFTDDDFGAYLVSKGVNKTNNFGDNGNSIGDEWYQISPEDARRYFDEFKREPSAVKVLRTYHLRKEQQEAVEDTTALKANGEDEALWNAKPRFGKCLSCYDFIKNIGAKRVLIVTNRPAVANSWYDDYMKYMGRKSGFFFVSRVSEIAKKEGVISYENYAKDVKERQGKIHDGQAMGMIYFASLQDIKGSRYFGTGGVAKLKELTEIHWDVLVVDESHEGVDTYKTEAAFQYIRRDFTLYLSGTPFKAIADEKFDTESIYNWTYVSEQEAKERWNGEGVNPYLAMPKLNMITYRLSNILGGAEMDFSGEEKETSGDGMNELFKVVGGKFVHEEDVDKFLDVISTNEKYPFGNETVRRELRHTFWLLQSMGGDNHAENVKQLKAKLLKHPLFKDYEIIVAADNGKIDDSEKSSASHYANVMKAIKDCENGVSGKRGTITLSVKSLTTGVTIPQWTGVLMLSERNSAAEYMQASFRAQNPCMFSETNKMTGETRFFRKTDAYVFDFNPEHTLDIVEQFANNLYSETANGKGDYEERKKNIDSLLHYMTVTGEDDEGAMSPLDAETVMLIPRKIRSEEVVRKGFMCDRLFQNISRVFRTSPLATEIVGKLPICTQTATKKADSPLTVTPEEVEAMHLDESGEVNVPDSFVEEEVRNTIPQEEKETLKATIAKKVQEVGVSADTKDKGREREQDALIKAYTQAAVQQVTESIKKKNPDVVSKTVEKAISREVAKEARSEVTKLYSDFVRNTSNKEDEIREEFKDCTSDEEKAAVEEMVQEAHAEEEKKFNENVLQSLGGFVDRTYNIADKEKEVAKATKIKEDKLDEFKKRLKSFTRTIPSFLMAYGDENFRIENMDTYVSPEVFQEVAYITVDEFRTLRDECKYFEPVVVNDAMQNFLRDKEALADYFKEGIFILVDNHKIYDIFDLIPPQKTNQIFTPQDVVKRMVDYLEEENPGCFDDPDNTFIDLYMKSGLYITEIVKRLFRSKKMVELFPDENERLQHIFDKQVYGLAPTEIIFQIAKNYILGFAKNRGLDINNSHFQCCDALPHAQKGTLKEKLDELFGA